jgi:RimJ/RimL family protein N-acetyltransferase
MSDVRSALLLRSLPDEIWGPRVRLRPYRPGDGAAVWAAIEESREHLRPWMPWVGEHISPDDSEAFVRRMHGQWILREDMGMGIWHRTEGTYLGSTGVHPQDRDVPSFEVGYWIRASQQGRGYAAEATRLMCRFAFETLGAVRLLLRCDTRNVRSASVARRVGFVEEGTVRSDSRDPLGGLRDTLMFSLLREEYDRVRTGWDLE